MRPRRHHSRQVKHDLLTSLANSSTSQKSLTVCRSTRTTSIASILSSLSSTVMLHLTKKTGLGAPRCHRQLRSTQQSRRLHLGVEGIRLFHLRLADVLERGGVHAADESG